MSGDATLSASCCILAAEPELAQRLSTKYHYILQQQKLPRPMVRVAAILLRTRVISCACSCTQGTVSRCAESVGLTIRDIRLLIWVLQCYSRCVDDLRVSDHSQCITSSRHTTKMLPVIIAHCPCRTLFTEGGFQLKGLQTVLPEICETSTA